MAQAREGGWRLKRLDVNRDRVESGIVWLTKGEELTSGAVEEMWLTMHEGDSVFSVCTSLTDGPAGAPELLKAIHHQLTHLALHNVSLDNGWTSAELISLQVLILGDVVTSADWPAFFPAPAELRVFGCKALFPSLQHDTLARMPQLRHFIMVLSTPEEAAALWPALLCEPVAQAPPVRLPPHLRSFTCLASSISPEDLTTWWTLECACADLGAKWDVRLDLRVRELETMDLEEWAYSVGA
ncbi:hypothetical protein JCM10296v2_007282 [Rhodotorula toruloides]